MYIVFTNSLNSLLATPAAYRPTNKADKNNQTKQNKYRARLAVAPQSIPGAHASVITALKIPNNGRIDAYEKSRGGFVK